MGMPVPLLPIQILLVNLATDGLPAIALGLEPPDKDVMRQRPRRANESVFSNGLGFTIVIRGLLIGLCTLGVFVSLIRSSGDLLTARTGALLALVLMQLIHVFECKSETKGLFSINPLNNQMCIRDSMYIDCPLVGIGIKPPYIIHQLLPCKGFSWCI